MVIFSSQRHQFLLIFGPSVVPAVASPHSAAVLPPPASSRPCAPEENRLNDAHTVC